MLVFFWFLLLDDMKSNDYVRAIACIIKIINDKKKSIEIYGCTYAEFPWSK